MNIQTPHNPHCKLVETNVFDGKNFLTIVFGVQVNLNKKGREIYSHQGLEVYYHKKPDAHFFKSRRFLPDEIPSKYKRYYESLSSRIGLVKKGHKLTVELTNE